MYICSSGTAGLAGDTGGASVNGAAFDAYVDRAYLLDVIANFDARCRGFELCGTPGIQCTADPSPNLPDCQQSQCVAVIHFCNAGP